MRHAGRMSRRSWSVSRPGRLLAAFALASLVGGALFGQVVEEGQPLGRGAAFGDAADVVEVPAGTKLRLEPGDRSEVLAVVDADSVFEVRRREGAWLQIDFGGYLVWFRAAARDDPLRQQVGELRRRDEERHGLVSERRRRHEQRVQRARRILGAAGQIEVGPFDLLTVLPAGDPRVEAVQVAAQLLPDAFIRRLGLHAVALLGEEAEEVRRRVEQDGLLPRRDVVVLFGGQRQYEEFVGGGDGLAGLGLGGHASSGLAAFYLDAQGSTDGVVASFLHEATHLLTYRWFGGLLPAWLEEGLAEDLGWSRIASDGTLELGSFPLPRVRRLGNGRRRATQTFLPGDLVQVCRTFRRWGRDLPSPGEVVSLKLEDFVAVSDRLDNYTLAGLTIRALLEGQGPAIAAARATLRAQLAAAASGQQLTPVAFAWSAALEEEVLDSIRGFRSLLEGDCAALRGAGR